MYKNEGLGEWRSGGPEQGHTTNQPIGVLFEYMGVLVLEVKEALFRLPLPKGGMIGEKNQSQRAATICSSGTPILWDSLFLWLSSFRENPNFSTKMCKNWAEGHADATGQGWNSTKTSHMESCLNIWAASQSEDVLQRFFTDLFTTKTFFLTSSI